MAQWVRTECSCGKRGTPSQASDGSRKCSVHAANKADSDTLNVVEKVDNPRKEAKSPQSYVIWRTPGAGFFSMITSTLAHIDIATSQRFVPVVDFDNHDSVYREDHPVHGTRNMWEYYFEQPAGRQLNEIGTDYVAIDGTWPKGYPYDLSASPVYRKMWDEYIRLTPSSQNFINSSCETLQISSRTLGVHYRGQEMRTAKGHRYPPTLRQVREAITWSLDNSERDEIFLVTEAEQYMRYFLKFFGSRVIPSPSFRLSRQNSYTVSRPLRKNHRYLLGLEALRDAVALSRCGGIICGKSNLSEAAIMLANHEMTPMIMISQGRNSFRPYVSPLKWYLKASLPPTIGGFPQWRPPAANSMDA